jgi:hypothetical protein
MTKHNWKPGDRVRDKLKTPKPGDECVEGTVLRVYTTNIVVDWDEADANGRKVRDSHPDLLVRA